MKTLLLNISPLFEITAIITHIWTVIIAFREDGFFPALISLFLPGLSEIYWIFRMFGGNDIYVSIALLHLILVVPISHARRNIPY